MCDVVCGHYGGCLHGRAGCGEVAGDAAAHGEERDVGASEQARSGPEADRAPRHVRREGPEVVRMVHRLRDARPRLRGLGRDEAPPRSARREARAALLRLGEDGEAEGRIRLRVARPARARNGGPRREALDLPLLRQPDLRERLPSRHEGARGDAQPRGVRGVDQVRGGVRPPLQGRCR